ncbi:MAG: hypothetical protein ABJM55_17360, partial [Rhodopirellula bahusiensis]
MLASDLATVLEEDALAEVSLQKIERLDAQVRTAPSISEGAAEQVDPTPHSQGLPEPLAATLPAWQPSFMHQPADLTSEQAETGPQGEPIDWESGSTAYTNSDADDSCDAYLPYVPSFCPGDPGDPGDPGGPSNPGDPGDPG